MQGAMFGGLAALLLLLLGSGVAIALALVAVGLFGLYVFTPVPVGQVAATSIWSATTSWTLASLPLFVWMGEILSRTRLSENMFSGLAAWVGRLPGGLLHVNNIGCGIFAAISGSSAVTAATIGRISLPELKARGYPDSISVGTLAGSATLGFLIPPSIPLIVYGVGAELSIARLFIAGVVPGLLILSMFVLYTGGWALLHRNLMPREERAPTFIERLRGLRQLGPVLLLLLAVVGSIYTGIATPTESAALGVCGALVLAALGGTLTWSTLIESLNAAARTTCMIGFILAGAALLSTMLAYTKLPIAMADYIVGLNLGPYTFILFLTMFYILLGCFLEGISIMVLSAAIFVPIVSKMGFDLIWFGIYLIVIIEMALITPPVGFNLFVIQSLTGRDIVYISRCALPFFVILCFMIVVMTAWPELVLTLPNKMSSR